MTADPRRAPLGPVGAAEPSGTQPGVDSPRAQWLTGVEHVSYGGDYNPEQWPEEVWAQDMALMREAGVNGPELAAMLLQQRLPAGFRFADA